MFTATKNRQADKDSKQPPVSKKKRLSRADRRQIEAAIARANRTDRKEKLKCYNKVVTEVANKIY